MKKHDRKSLGTLLRYPYEVLAEWLYGRLAEEFEGVRLAHSAVLRHLDREGSRVVDLAAAAGMTKQSMAYLVDQLSEAGYLYTQPDATDGRAKQVRLTERGEALYARALALSAEAEARLADLLGGEDAGELRRILERLHQRWVLEDPPPGNPG